MSTRESLSAQQISPFLSVCTRCASRHSLPLQLGATNQLPLNSLSGPTSYEHTKSVSESFMWHTLHTIDDVSCGALCTCRAGRRRCRTLASRAPLRCLDPRGTASRAPSCSSFLRYRKCFYLLLL